MAAPSKYPEWAEDTIAHPVSGILNKIEPDNYLKTYGNRFENPSKENLNYQLNLINKWIQHLASVSGSGSSVTKDFTKECITASTGAQTIYTNAQLSLPWDDDQWPGIIFSGQVFVNIGGSGYALPFPFYQSTTSFFNVQILGELVETVRIPYLLFTYPNRTEFHDAYFTLNAYWAQSENIVRTAPALGPEEGGGG